MKCGSFTIVHIALMILTLTGFSFGQITTITDQEYWHGIISGYAASRDIFPRKETTTYEGLTDSVVTISRTEVSEFLSKNTYRTTKTVVRDGITNRSEVIQIGKVRYCRENNSEWKTSGCYQQPPPPLGDSDQTQYSLQVNKESRTFIRIAKLQKKGGDNAQPTTYLTEDKFVLNGDGSVRERGILTTVSATNSNVSREISKFEYGITLSPIDAPIK